MLINVIPATKNDGKKSELSNSSSLDKRNNSRLQSKREMEEKGENLFSVHVENIWGEI